MKISRYLIMFSLFFTQAHADEPDLQFLGRVLKVDGHNVLTVGDAKGNLRILSLAYISTPVRTEPYFEAVNAHLKGYVGDWFQFTVVSYGRHANVQPVLMRDTKQKSINSMMVKEGLAMVNMATNPPVSLIDQAYAASESKVGLWGQDEKFDPLARNAFGGINLKDMLRIEGKNGLVPYVKDPTSMKAFPVLCAFTPRAKSLPIALTAHVAKREGYQIMENCDEFTKK